MPSSSSSTRRTRSGWKRCGNGPVNAGRRRARAWPAGRRGQSGWAPRRAQAKAELHKLIAEEELKDALLLVYANKQDLPQAMSVQEMAEGLGLQSIPGRVWYIQACSAASGQGISTGLEWLAAKLAAKKRS